MFLAQSNPSLFGETGAERTNDRKGTVLSDTCSVRILLIQKLITDA